MTNVLGSPGEELLEGVVGLFAELSAVGQEENASGPLGPDQGFTECDGDPRLAGARRLDDEGLTAAVGEPLDDFLDGADLVEPVNDSRIGAEIFHAETVLRLKDQVLQAVLRVEPEDAANGIVRPAVVLPLVPEIDLVPVCAEDNRSLAELAPQALGVQLGLRSAFLGVLRRPLGLDDGERLAVVAPKDVVGIALAGGRGLKWDRVLPGDLVRVGRVPARGHQPRVNELGSRLLLVQVKRCGRLLSGRLCGAELFVRAGGDWTLGSLGLDLRQQLLILGLERRILLDDGLLLALESLLGLLALGGRRLRERRQRGRSRASVRHEQPSAEVVRLPDQGGSRGCVALLAVGRLVAHDAEPMELRQDDFRDRLPETVVLQEVDQIGLVRFGQAESIIQELNESFGEAPQLYQAAGRIGIGIPLGKSTELGQLRPVGSQELEVGRFQVTLLEAMVPGYDPAGIIVPCSHLRDYKTAYVRKA